MTIAIEAQRIFRTTKHGMDFVALEAIRHLQQIDTTNQYYIFVSPGEDRCLSETPNFKIVELRCPTYPLWEQVALPIAIAKLKPDLLHCTSNTAPIFCSAPLVVTLHDIIFLEARHGGGTQTWYQNMGWHYRRLVVPRILDKCRQIITVSNFECNRIREAIGLEHDKIKAIYNGYSAHFKPVADREATIAKYIDQPDYIFFLGNTDPKKNTARTLLAYSIYLQSSGKKLPLLIADISQQAVYTLLAEQNIEWIKPYLHFTGYVANRDLPAIYSGAFAFLYTSLRESFGIPILEAMACGTPIITSDTSSMPEIAGSGAILVDPRQEQQIADALLHLESDADHYARQVAYGLERVKSFSWQHTAEHLLDTYRSIGKQDQR